ncbi:MAG: hypothetical protein QXJ12_01720, partial [Candidatus Parvarchaeota archaeon]|nr:hypothetical protein [Candidatus Parvarchaeota archaeon]
MLIKVDRFSLDATLSAGQTFSWFKSGDSWIRLVGGPVIVRQIDERTIEAEGESEAGIKRLLGLYDDISKINSKINKDRFISEAIDRSEGLRVVEDGLWPAVLGFILSIQSNISLIRRRVQLLSRLYGEETEVEGEKFYTFPSWHSIANKPGLLSKAKLGFRSKFVESAAKRFSVEDIEAHRDGEELAEILSSINGVGPKVLDCIMLYGLHKLSYFPMDVWIWRALKRNYPHIIGDHKSYKAVNQAICDYFGEY